MSYNITNWRVKKLEQLDIPLAALQFPAEYCRRGFVATVTVEPQDVITVTALGLEIAGWFVDGKTLRLTKVELDGEGSGTDYNALLLPALRQSTGQLEVVIVWEGGDTITRLTVDNGVVTEQEVDL